MRSSSQVHDTRVKELVPSDQLSLLAVGDVSATGRAFVEVRRTLTLHSQFYFGITLTLH